MYTPAIDLDVPIAKFTPMFRHIGDRIAAAYSSLAEVGSEPIPTAQDRANSHAVFIGGKEPTEEMLSSPGTVAHLAAILNEYDKQVLQSAGQLRTYITNRLILESDNGDPRIRIKALEMLGKISDVGLFTDKTEITMRHRPTAELEQMLRERLTKVVEGDFIEVPPKFEAKPLDITDIVGPAA